MQIVNRDSLIIKWLYLISFMVFCMVFIGGITRLTDSGLSMVDWKPIMGIIPPLTDAAWQSTFQKYQAFPEFKLVNSDMTLAGFKSIYFWEYFHRVFGRLIGMAFFFPYVYFRLRRYISKSLNRKLIIAFVLGGLQGLMGWYMVKSGLVNKPDVSHLRLAAHLSLAFIIIGYIMWTILGIKNPQRKISFNKKLKALLIVFFGLLCVQIIYGAFVAGLDAGLTHNTFPKMGRDFVPTEVISVFKSMMGFISNPVFVQFTHRVMGWSLLICAVALGVKLKESDDFMQKKTIKIMLCFLLIQFTLGVMTLVMYVPVSIASIHQVGACILLLLCVRALFFTFTEAPIKS